MVTTPVADDANRLRDDPIIAVAAGSGQVVSRAVAAGADLLMALNAGLYRNLGVGSLAAFLPYGNANRQTERLLLEQILPQSRSVPVMAGVLGNDPTIDLDAHLSRLRKLGVAAVTNWPAIGFIDGQYREALEEDGLGIASEIAMLARAKAHGLEAYGFALDQRDAERFAESGVDGLILNLGLTPVRDDAHEHRDRLQQAIVRLNAMVATVRRGGRRPLCLAFGGPVTTPEDFDLLLRHAAIDGFAGGSVFERLPIHDAIEITVRRFKSVAVERGQRAKASDAAGLKDIVGRSPPMRELFRLVRRVAPMDLGICIQGESGTGKELVAVAIHQLSDRASKPFVTLNCGALPDSLIESELFGHEKGAFTGADRRRLGKFELAHGGTLFLDEIADLTPRGQVALLRAIQQGEITRVGGERSLPVDVRILTASHQPLARMVAEGRFRADLYYRINQFTIEVPPLRARSEDIPLIVQALLSKLSVRLNRQVRGLTTGFHDKLLRHGWPGNVRELQQVVTNAAVVEDGAVLQGQHFLPVRAVDPAAMPPVATRDFRAHQRELVHRALADAGGNKSAAAAALGISRKTLYAWMKPGENAAPGS